MAMGDVHYLTCPETAKLVRTALRESFPGVKFSVRAKTYSGGASISVWWTEGPMRADVEAVARQFEGADFDGMIDLKSSRQHWLTSDGRVRLAYREGTTGSRGVIEPMVDEPIPGAQRVHFGADFIFCTRILSNELRQTIQDKIAAATGKPYGDYERYGALIVDGRHYPIDSPECGSTVVWPIANEAGTPVLSAEEIAG